MIQKILVPLDGSLLSDGALAPVKRLLHAEDATLVLLTVAPDAAAGVSARRHVEALARALEGDGIAAEARLAVGDPATRILEAADEIRPSLIALSTHARAGLERLARGSVAEKVLRRSPYPVLLVNPRSVAESREGRFRRILVPLDGSDRSAEVLPLAREIAKRHEGELVLLHSVDVGVYLDPVPAVSPAESPAEVERLFARFVQKAEGVPVRVRSTMGAPASSILEGASEEQADLIALTTHGRSGPSRWIYGSVAEQVVRKASCPVLVLRTGGFGSSEAARPEAASSTSSTQTSTST